MKPQQGCIIIVTNFHMIMLVGSCSLQVELMSYFQIVHVSFESGKITFNVSGIHIIHIKDGHKGPPKTLHFDERGGLRDVDIVNTENTSNERVHINAFHLINITVES